MSNQSTHQKLEAAKEAFDLIDEQIFKDQFNSETSKQLDKLFLTAIMDGDLDSHERTDICLMYFNLKKLLKTVRKGVEPNAIDTICMDISMYYSA